MNNKDSIIKALIAVLSALLILTIVVWQKAKYELNEIKDGVVDIKYYTYGYDEPEPKKDSTVAPIRVSIPVYVPGKIDTLYIGKDSSDVITSDGDSLNIPITQKVYSDSNYTAYVSGFNANLDSIRFRIPEITRTKIVENNKRFSIGAIGGVGYGLSSKKIEPFLGVGLSYRLY